MAAPVLQVDDLHVFYGQIHALRGVNLEVRKDQIVTLIGGNGAGKTTTLKTISSILAPAEGEIRLEGARLNDIAPHKVVGMGVVHVPEGRRIFGRLSVQENLNMGAFLRNDKGAIKASEDRVFELFPRLKERIGQTAGTLSGGEQQMLAMGRAIMSHPQVLLLDEPSMGLAPIIVDQVFDAIQNIRDQGVTVLLVEQNALMALRVADYGYVIETGEIVLTGPGQDLLKNEQVIEAYLG